MNPARSTRGVGRPSSFFSNLNDAETRLQRERGTYVALVDAVSRAGVPFGFVRRLVFDRWSYIVSLKDTLDPCGFSLFSDQDGVIYEAPPSAGVADESRGKPPDAAPGPLDR